MRNLLVAVLLLTLASAASAQTINDITDPAIVPVCGHLDGLYTEAVRAQVPPETITKGAIFCRMIIQDGQYTPGSSYPQIGVMDFTGANIIQAVDVFGLSASGIPQANLNNPVQMCLAGEGRIAYVGGEPREVTYLPVSISGGYTCTTLPDTGVVLLLG